MLRPTVTGAQTCACLILLPSLALAHAVCGPRVFPVTLTLDDPGVSDELTLPQVTYQRSGIDDGVGPTHETDFGFEYDKRITPDTAIIFNDAYDRIQTNGAATQAGWDDLTVTGKWAACLSSADEFMLGFGVQREFGRTGTAHTGANEYGNTAPTVYFGKGFGSLSTQALRPFAVSGELIYAIADREANTTRAIDPATGMSIPVVSNGYPNSFNGGLSLQYSIPYLQSQVRNLGITGPLADIVPLVEVTWSAPLGSPVGGATAWTVAPGFIYINRALQIGLEALIPANTAAGTNVGVTVQFHLFLDDLLPHSLGRPLFDF